MMFDYREMLEVLLARDAAQALVCAQAAQIAELEAAIDAGVDHLNRFENYDGFDQLWRIR